MLKQSIALQKLHKFPSSAAYLDTCPGEPFGLTDYLSAIYS